MDGIALILSLFIAAGVVLFVVWPWVKLRQRLSAGEDFNGRADLSAATVQTLKTRQEALITALRDLEFDHAVEKVTDADYQRLRQSLLAQTTTILQQIEEAEASLEAERLLVKAVPRRVASLASAKTCPACHKPARPDAHFCTHCGSRLPDVCPDCGKQLLPDDRFCTHCGAAVNSVPA